MESLLVVAYNLMEMWNMQVHILQISNCALMVWKFYSMYIIPKFKKNEN